MRACSIPRPQALHSAGLPRDLRHLSQPRRPQSCSSPAARPASAPTSCAPSRRNDARVAFLDVQRRSRRSARRRRSHGERRARPLFPQLRRDRHRRAASGDRGSSREQLGPIAVLVNNAANDERHAVADVTADYWDHAQNVNLRHHFFAAQAVHPQMSELGFGSIINLSSIAWRGGGRHWPPMPPPRPAIVGLTHCARARLRPRQHPRQRDRARRGHDRAAAAAVVSTPEASVDAIVQRQIHQADVCSATRSRGRRCSSPPTTAA